jgi:hypothetical protein
MEWVYAPLCGAQVTADLLRAAAEEAPLTELIRRAFAEQYFHSEEVRPLTGRNYLTGELIRKYALKILERDRKLTPFRYLESEKRMQAGLQLSGGQKVRLKGFIDRLDEVNGRIRVVDYKSGVRKPLEYTDTESLFDPRNGKRQPAVMQVFLYAWMYGETAGIRPVQPVVYYMRALFGNDFDPSVCGGVEKNEITDFNVCRNAFEDSLRHCLEELFSPEIPFTQTQHTKVCTYCYFKEICSK